MAKMYYKTKMSPEYKMNRVMRKSVLGFTSRSDTNCVVWPQMMAGGLTFRI